MTKTGKHFNVGAVISIVISLIGTFIARDIYYNSIIGPDWKYYNSVLDRKDPNEIKKVFSATDEDLPYICDPGSRESVILNRHNSDGFYRANFYAFQTLVLCITFTTLQLIGVCVIVFVRPKD